MVSGKLTSEKVTTAICHRAALAQQFTNCLTESTLTTHKKLRHMQLGRGMGNQLAVGRCLVFIMFLTSCFSPAFFACSLSLFLTNSVHNKVFFEEGIAHAKQIDADFAKTGKPLGKLHGLPVSLKDDNNVPGKLTTWGLSEWAKKPVGNYGAVPLILKEEGAVFYCKTNVPQVRSIAKRRYYEGSDCLQLRPKRLHKA